MHGTSVDLFDRISLGDFGHMRDVVNIDTIRRAAHSTARHLNERGADLAIFAPGDATEYRIMIHRYRANYWVAAHPGGGSYEWAGHAMPDPGYVSASWNIVHDWTAVVLCLFLTALADELANLEVPA